MVTGDREPATAVLYCPPAGPGLALTLNRVRSTATARPVPVPCSGLLGGHFTAVATKIGSAESPARAIIRPLTSGATCSTAKP